MGFETSSGTLEKSVMLPLHAEIHWKKLMVKTLRLTEKYDNVLYQAALSSDASLE